MADTHNHDSHSDHNHDHCSGHGHSHSHDHDHGHGHSHAPSVTNKNEKVVLFCFVLTFIFMMLELVGGYISGSLALMADAGHMFTDSFALLLAWSAFRFGRRASDSKKTFGYMRFEVLAGLINALFLFALTGWIIYEAILRLMEPGPVLAGSMFVIAVAGLLINILVFYILNRGDKDHVNIRGAMLHVLGDILGSVAAIIAAIVMYYTNWTPIDPILSVLLSILILRSTWFLTKDSLHILMEGTPSNIKISELREYLLKTIPNIKDVGHIHVWSITSGQVSATLEALLKDNKEAANTVKKIKSELNTKFKIQHTTVEVVWDHTDSDDNCNF